MGQNYSIPSFLRLSSHSQPSPSPSPSLSPHPMALEVLQLPSSPPPPENQVENQNEDQQFGQTLPESESPRDEELVNDSSSVSDDQTMRTPCFRKPTPTKTTTRELTSSKRRRLTLEFEKNAGDESPEKKKKAEVVNGRLWSEEDEVVILKGLMDFQSKNGADYPYPDMGEFHELIKKSLSFDASQNQFLDKIRKLRRKYVNNVEKGKKLAVFLSKPHEQECFELSKRIWGDVVFVGTGGGASCTRARKSTVKQLDNIVALGEIKAKDLEKKWQIWRENEVALRLRQDELIEEQNKLMLDAIKASKE